MSNLENLVPPLDLCRRIPCGTFADSALVWYLDAHSPNSDIALVPRSFAVPERSFPAPTLQEILAVIPSDSLADFYINATDNGYKVDMIANNRSTTIANGDNPATAALNVWLELNKEGEQ